MKINFEDFVVRKCDLSHMDEILKIQNETFAELGERDILRENSEEMLRACLMPPNLTLGAWYGDTLAAFAVLYFPFEEAENLSLCLENINIEGLKVANAKLCIVRKPFRGNSLQYELGCKIEAYALEVGVKLLCATVSPDNTPSLNNIRRLGFSCNRQLSKYGSDRFLFYKYL